MRRSDRVFVRIPVLVRGIDDTGATFAEKVSIVAISKHGAAIELPRPMEIGMGVTIDTAQSLRFEATIVWIGSVASKTAGQVGVECSGLADSLGFHFPPL